MYLRSALVSRETRGMTQKFKEGRTFSLHAQRIHVQLGEIRSGLVIPYTFPNKGNIATYSRDAQNCKTTNRKELQIQRPLKRTGQQGRSSLWSQSEHVLSSELAFSGFLTAEKACWNSYIIT